MFKNSKLIKSILLLSLLTSTSLAAISPLSSEAAELNSEVSAKLTDNIALESGISYVDASGATKEVAIPKGTEVTLNATSKKIVVKIGKESVELTNVKEVTFKNITVTKLVPFYLDGVEKVTLDGVDFQKGVDFSGMGDVRELIVKNSNFGSSDYSLAIHSAPNLETFIVDNATLNADLRIYSNKNLSQATVSNSVLKDDAKQYSNKKGYKTDYVNTRFERPKGLRVINSGGMSANDIFYMNPGETTNIGQSKFDASKPGTIYYAGEDKEVKQIDVPINVSIDSIKDSKDTITIKFSNGEKTILSEARSLYFRNVDIQGVISFVNKKLKLESLEFANCRTKLIDVAYSETLKSFAINGTEVSQSTGYVSVYNNKSLESFVMQDSKVTGSSGYISVYNIPTLKQFVMNNDYTYGYLSTYNLGASSEDLKLQLSNSQYDDYISSTNVIEGEAGRQVVGFVPELSGPSSVVRPKFGKLTEEYILGKDFEALDKEDGDITSSIKVLTDLDTIDTSSSDSYQIKIEVMDSDGNKVQHEFTMNVV